MLMNRMPVLLGWCFAVTAILSNGAEDTRSDHLFVEHVDIATHRFVLDGRVVVVGVVNSNGMISPVTVFGRAEFPAFTV
jgi:hypothetical protein